MPGMNQMGPMGQGPMTGRGMGWCAGANAPGDARRGGPGFGMGRGRGRGFQGGSGGGRHGWRHCFQATGVPGWMRSGAGQAPIQAPATKAEMQSLQSQAEMLREQLEHIEHRLNELSQPEPDETR